MNRGRDVLKQRGLFRSSDGEAASQLARPKGKRRLRGEHDDDVGDDGDVAEATSRFVRFKGDRFRIKTGLECDAGSRPHTGRFPPWGLAASIA